MKNSFRELAVFACAALLAGMLLAACGDNTATPAPTATPVVTTAPAPTPVVTTTLAFTPTRVATTAQPATTAIAPTPAPATTTAASTAPTRPAATTASSGLEALPLFRRVQEATFNYTSARFEIKGVAVNAHTGALEDYSYSAIVLKKPGDPYNYVAYSIDLQKAGIRSQYRHVNGKYYKNEDSNGWVADAETNQIYVPYNTLPFGPWGDGATLDITLLPDQSRDGLALGQMSGEVTNTAGQVIAGMELLYEKNTLRPVHLLWQDSLGNRKDWSAFDYDSPNLKVEEPTQAGGIPELTPTPIPKAP